MSAAALAVILAGRIPSSVVPGLFQRQASELWALRTPYYHVDVKLEVLSTPERFATEALPVHHAVLIVYDPSDAPGWRVAREVMESMKSCTEDRPALLLAEESGDEKWVLTEREFNEHALNCGFEFVLERSKKAPQQQTDDATTVSSGLLAEAEGRARVREALAAHRWPGLTPIQRRRPPLEQQTQVQAQPSSTASLPSSAPSLLPAAAASAAPPPSSEESIGAPPIQVMAQVRERLDRAGAADLGEGPDDGDEQDLSALLKEMLALRAHATQLPDAERRALAASVALYFAEKLGPDQ